MIRNLKALGLALVAVFALSAMASASASAHTFGAESAPVTLHATQEPGAANQHIFSLTGKEIKCDVATFHGTQANTSDTVVTVHPTYEGCKFAGIETTVNTHSCNYIFHNETPAANMALVDIECAHGEPITLSVGGLCTVKVGDTHPPATGTVNQGLSGVSYTNIGTGTTREVTVKATVTGISAVVEGGLCFLAGVETGTHTTATYTGTATLTGTEDGGGTGHIGVFFS